MAINKKIKGEKLQYHIDRETGKISSQPTCKTDRYKYLTGEKILFSCPNHIIEQAKSTYSPLRKSFEKQANIITEDGDTQIEAIKNQGKIQAETLQSLRFSGKKIPVILKFYIKNKIRP